MNEERRVSREGIHIDRDLADALAIEEELDSNIIESDYLFPDPRRRRTPAVIYAVLTVVVAVVIDPVVALIPAGLAIWHALAAWPLKMQPEAALGQAAQAVPFSVGHASAALGFVGLRARPQWSVVLYSAAEPPDQRALVVVNALTGEVVGEPFVEELDPL